MPDGMNDSLEQTGLSGIGRTGLWRPRNHLIAALSVIFFMYLCPIILLIVKNQSLRAEDYVFYLTVYCPMNIIIIFILLRYLCGERYWDLDFREGRISADLAASFLLTLIILVSNVLLQRLLALFLPDPPGTNVRNLFLGMSEGPVSLPLFIGPMLLLGAAAEELTRVFLLSRLWKIMPSRQGKVLALVISAVLYGLLHVSRGPTNMVWATLSGLFMGLYYLRFGRVMPLFLAHYLSNAIQVLLVLVLFGPA